MPGDATALLAALVEHLLTIGVLTEPAVEAAFRAVPRHLFLPNLPFDDDSSVPCSATLTSNLPTCNLSTNHATAIVLGFVTYGCGGSIPTPDSGFAMIQSFTGSCNADSAIEYRIVSTSQTNLQIGFALSVSSEWDLIGDVAVSA